MGLFQSMDRSVWRRLCLAGAVLLLLPGSARADGLFTLFAGSTVFKADFGQTSESHSSLVYGGTLTFKRKAGIEIDWGYANHYTGETDVDTDNARTLVFNFITDIGPKRGRVQPYVSAGAGLISIHVATLANLFRFDSNFNDLVFDVGGGVMVTGTDRIGVKVDIRYFKDLEDIPTPDPNVKANISAVRVSGGVTFRF